MGMNQQITVRINVLSILFLMTACKASGEIFPFPTVSPSISILFQFPSGAASQERRRHGNQTYMEASDG